MPIVEPIVELGSRPAEGQEEIANLRPLFPGKEYIGCDLQPGTGVDRIEDIHKLTFADNSVGTVIALDTLEHVADPLQAVREMHRILKPGGFCAISSVMFFPIHAHPWDYWRFTPEGFSLLLEPFETRLVIPFGFDLMPENVYGVGVKGPFENLELSRFPRTERRVKGWAAGKTVDFGPIRMSLRELWGQAFQHTARRARERLSGRGSRDPAPYV